MSVDLRGFVYELEPLRRQRQWKLDTLLARLGRIQVAIQEAQESIEQMKHEQLHQSREAAASFIQRRDPDHHLRCLAWLTHLKAGILAAESRLHDLEAERSKLRILCLVQKQKVDVVELHREESVIEFTREEAGRIATEADRDWMARAAFRRVLRKSGLSQSGGRP